MPGVSFVLSETLPFLHDQFRPSQTTNVQFEKDYLLLKCLYKHCYKDRIFVFLMCLADSAYLIRFLHCPHLNIEAFKSRCDDNFGTVYKPLVTKPPNP